MLNFSHFEIIAMSVLLGPLSWDRLVSYSMRVTPPQLECVWDNFNTNAEIYEQRDGLVVALQCEMKTSNPSHVILRGMNSSMSLDLCDTPSMIYDVTVCTGPVFGHHDTSNLIDWIELNRRQWGIGRFVLYERNASVTNLKSILSWYIRNDYVEIVSWPYIGDLSLPEDRSLDDAWSHREYFDQTLLLNHCLNSCRSTSRWILIIDVDEIVVVSKSIGSLASYLEKHDENTTALELSTVAFTYNNKTEQLSTRFTIENTFRQAVPLGYSRQETGPSWAWRSKTIFQPRFVNFAWIHGFFSPQDACHHSLYVPYEAIRVHHYVDKRNSDLSEQRCSDLDVGNPCDHYEPPLGALDIWRDSDDRRYLSFVETEDLNNQRAALEVAWRVAMVLNRTLIVPDFVHLHEFDGFIPRVPLRTCSIWDCNSFPSNNWVFRSTFGRMIDVADTETCHSVESCEKIILHDGGHKVLDLALDKLMMHLYVTEKGVLRGLSPHKIFLPYAPRIMTAARNIIHELGSFNAAHLRLGDTLKQVLDVNFDGHTSRIEAFISRSPRKVYIMTDATDHPLLAIPNVISGKNLIWESFSRVEVGAIEQIICAHAQEFLGFPMSSTTQLVWKIRSERPSWAALVPNLAKDTSVVCSIYDWCEKKPHGIGLLLSYWASKSSSPRRREIEAAIVSNLLNPNLEIYVVLDGSSSKYNCEHLQKDLNSLFLQISNGKQITPWSCIDRSGSQPSYKDLVEYALKIPFQADVVVIANSDVVFDESISKLSGVQKHSLVVLSVTGGPHEAPAYLTNSYKDLVSKNSESDPLSRRTSTRCCHDEKCQQGPFVTGGECNCDKRWFRWPTMMVSWDALAFRWDQAVDWKKADPYFLNTEGGEFYTMNEDGAENSAAEGLYHLLQVSNSSAQPRLKNACGHVGLWQFHLESSIHRVPTRVVGVGTKERNGNESTCDEGTCQVWSEGCINIKECWIG